MPFEELAVWNAHFTRRPPDAIERLLGVIAMTLINAHRKENTPAVSMHQIAPWLEPPEEKKKREFDEETGYLANVYYSTQDED